MTNVELRYLCPLPCLSIWKYSRKYFFNILAYLFTGSIRKQVLLRYAINVRTEVCSFMKVEKFSTMVFDTLLEDAYDRDGSSIRFLLLEVNDSISWPFRR